MTNTHHVRPQTDALSAAFDFDLVRQEVGKLTRLLEILDEIAVTHAPMLNAGPDAWERYVERIAAVLTAMLAFSGDIEHLAADYATRLRATSASAGDPPEARHAA